MKRKTILKHSDFFMPMDAICVRGERFLVKAKPTNALGNARYGLVASKRVFKLAVERNRAKRLLRDWLAFNEDAMRPELEYVFYAHKNILESTRDAGRDDMATTLAKVARTFKYNERQKQIHG